MCEASVAWVQISGCAKPVHRANVTELGFAWVQISGCAKQPPSACADFRVCEAATSLARSAWVVCLGADFRVCEANRIAVGTPFAVCLGADFRVCEASSAQASLSGSWFAWVQISGCAKRTTETGGYGLLGCRF